ncbi:MAG: DUF5688 family protein [Lachnospiraceae bacterium]|nr:DUF5688 family protein [Lachnospiraceae bacterium]
MTREMIINELNNRGYDAEAQNVIKNSVELEGIRIMTDNTIAPVIYTEAIIRDAEDEGKTLDEVVSAIISIYEGNKSFDFDINVLYDKDYILNSLYIGLQKDSTEDIVKRSCDLEGIESYLYIRGDSNRNGSFSIKVSKNILEHANISEVEAWNAAEKNTFAETTIESMAKVLADMLGYDYSEDMDNDTPFFVISNKSKIKGASSILNKQALAEFGRRYQTDRVVVLGSSIHEMLLVPYTEEVDLDAFSQMVGDVNATEVDPTERLTDRAYIINLR